VETPKVFEMTRYLRQTLSWEKYLNSIGWKSFRTVDKLLIVYRITPFGRFAKLQRPHILNEKILLELDALCKRHKILFLKVETSTIQDTDLLASTGYIVSNTPLGPTTTMQLDLTISEKTLWNNLSTSGKYGVNRGKKNNSKIEFIKNPSEDLLLKYFNTIQAYTSKSKGFHTLSWKEIHAVTKAFKNNTYLSFGYDANNNLAGGKLYLVNETNIFYLTGGTTELGRHNRVGFVQMWESILFFKDLGYKILDLDGMYDIRFPNHRRSWIGFSNFKEKFGGTLTRYPAPYIKYYSPILKLLSKVLPLDF
jgi:lipid II:glycine glycyltransferase (peptidoglycan interpeptide bridge formation enzyme)